MGASVHEWIIVYDDGHTQSVKSAYPPEYNEMEDIYSVVAIIKNGYCCGE